MPALRRHIERLVDVETFSMKNLRAEAWALIQAENALSGPLTALAAALPARDFLKVSTALLRWCFLIELVKVPKIETTKFRTRWYEQLQGDPRGASFAECFEMLHDLVSGLPGWLADPNNAEALSLAVTWSILPYEAPIDYLARSAANGQIHTRGNLRWYCDDLVLRTLRLRKFLLDASTSPDVMFFDTVLRNKICVKTYLTDRVQTGSHKTNREKRWEVHPQSVHFAFRRTCLAIEYTLLTQLCAFRGFPAEARELLQRERILPNELQDAVCPITGDHLNYAEFHEDLINPRHGKSEFQVGHLNPLKGVNGAGHTADNISWISAHGNRIQGSMELVHVRDLLRRIADNHVAHNWWPRQRQ